MADAFLCHDRDIVIRSDDSVIRCDEGGVQFLRRGRGQTPRPIKLKDEGPAVLAFGPYLKNTLCVVKGREAYLSQHIGDLDNVPTVNFLEETAAHLLHILDVEPQVIAHDLHPDFPSTRLAAAFAAERGIPAIAVAHHHAHIAAVLAETRYPKPVIGLALDGIGLGEDGGLWGGELLRVDGADCRRLGGLLPLQLPGGDKAAREPWRLAAAALHALGRNGDIEAFVVDEVLVVVPERRFELKEYSVQVAGRGRASASITLRDGTGEVTDAAAGNGPVDAAYSAIRRLVGISPELSSYRIQATSERSDAMGEAVITLRLNGLKAQGPSTDVIESSIKAYVNAVNRLYALAAAKGETLNGENAG